MEMDCVKKIAHADAIKITWFGGNIPAQKNNHQTFVGQKHMHTTVLRLCGFCPDSGSTRVSRYQKKHSPTHTHRGHQPSLSAFSIYCDPWHPPYSIHVLYSLFPQSLSNTCPYHFNLFHCSTEIMLSIPSLPLSSLLRTLSCNFTPHIHLTILISALWSATLFSFLTGQVSHPCNILHRTQLLYNLPLTYW